MDVRKLTSLFASPDERLVAVLGNTVAESFLSTGFLGNGFAVLSDKRVYFRGRCLARSGKHFSARKEERVVDVQDITGTGFVFINPIWIFVLSIILFCGLLISFIAYEIISAIGSILLGGIALAIYFSKKRTLFEISFAGGGIAFDVRWFSAEEAQFFQKNIKLIGDSAKGQKESAVRTASVADELNKLANLMANGLITREEYEAQKRSMMYPTDTDRRETYGSAPRFSTSFYSSGTDLLSPKGACYCSICGSLVSAGSAFCTNCGVRFSGR